jgi:hypothetical protein
MAKEPGRDKPHELKREIALSRDLVARDLRSLRCALDFKRKIRRSFQENATVWIGAAVVVGTLLVLLPMRRKKVYVDAGNGNGKGREPKSKLLEAGFLLGALRIAVTLLRPAISSFVTKKLQAYSGSQSQKKW